MRIPIIKKKSTCSVCKKEFTTGIFSSRSTCPTCSAQNRSVKASEQFVDCDCGNTIPASNYVCPHCLMKFQISDGSTVEVSGTDHKEVLSVASDFYSRFSEQSDPEVKTSFWDKYSEEQLCLNIHKSLLHIQKNPVLYNRPENVLNDSVRDNLRMVYSVLDQTRQGTSQSGNDAGSIDMLICTKDGLPLAIIEAMKLTFVDRAYISLHIDKVLTNYDPAGCPYVFVLTYASCSNFESFCTRLFHYLRAYDYPHGSIELIQLHPVAFSESNHIQVVLNRSGKSISIHFLTVNIPPRTS